MYKVREKGKYMQNKLVALNCELLVFPQFFEDIKEFDIIRVDDGVDLHYLPSLESLISSLISSRDISCKPASAAAWRMR